MKKNIEWLKEEIGELPCVDTVFNNGGSSYIDSAVPVMAVYDLLDQLDNQEVLSQEWIDKYVVHVRGLGDMIEAEAVENLLVPKQELPVIPKFVAVYLNIAKREITLMRSLEIANRRSELPKWEKEYDWISENDEKFARAWLDGFTVEEEQKYYALIKGHENIGSDDKYWNYCITDEGLDIGGNKVHADVLAEYVLSATKDEWKNLGINEDNAEFVEVEELEENDKD